MKKKNESLAGVGCLRDGAYAIEAYKISHIEGKLLTFIESMGLRESQEKATKDIMREILWSITDSSKYGNFIFIQGEDLIELESKYYREGQGGGTINSDGPHPR